MAHLDVVPIDADAPWQHPPFGAEIADSPTGPAIWGRGTLDDKGCVVAICEAVELLLEAGHVPAQDVWLSFGCDEEVSGTAALAAVDAPAGRGGPAVVRASTRAARSRTRRSPGSKPPLGVIGVTEKGTTSVELVAEGRGGHASTPARNGPTARIARAILRVEKSPFPASAPGPDPGAACAGSPRTSRCPCARSLSRADRIAPAVTRALLAAGPEAAAMTRTTVAATTLSGSPALNVIASTAQGRAQRAGDGRRHRRRRRRPPARGDQGRQHPHRRRRVGRAVSPVSPMDDAFRLIESCIGEVFADAVPTPYVMMAATDSRHFTEICERVYRFAPFRMTKAQRQAIHSYDEHLGVSALVDGVRWYRTLIERLPA